jgi:hypothetical protein
MQPLKNLNMQLLKSLNLILSILSFIFFTSCERKQTNESNRVPPDTIGISNSIIDSTKNALPRNSIGILTIKNEFETIFDDCKIYNINNSLYAKINLYKNTVEIGKDTFQFDFFVNNYKLRDKLNFNPFNFYFEPTIINFEVNSMIKDTAIVYIDNKLEIIKKLNLKERGIPVVRFKSREHS